MSDTGVEPGTAAAHLERVREHQPNGGVQQSGRDQTSVRRRGHRHHLVRHVHVTPQLEREGRLLRAGRVEAAVNLEPPHPETLVQPAGNDLLLRSAFLIGEREKRRDCIARI